MTIKTNLLFTTAISVSALLLAGCPSASNTEQTVEKIETAAAQTSPGTAENSGSELMEASQKTMSASAQSAPTVQEAKEFLEDAEVEISEFGKFAARTAWIKANFITQDTNALEARMAEQGATLSTRYANEAKRFNDLNLPADMRRKMDGLLRGSNFPAPDNPKAAKELAEIMTSLDSAYGTGTFEIDVSNPDVIKILDKNGDGSLEQEVPKGKIHLGQASDIIAMSDDPALLSQVWEGWRTVSPAMKKDYARMVEIINEGAQELGFKDAGDLWRAGYDMDAAAFSQEADRLWGQVKPLYDELHCYVRAELNAKHVSSKMNMTLSRWSKRQKNFSPQWDLRTYQIHSGSAL